MLGATRGSSPRQADPEVEPQRLGDLGAEDGAERVAGDAPQDLADEVPEHECMVAVSRARLTAVPWRPGLDDRVPVA